MEGLAIVNKGLEDIGILEVKEIIGAKAQAREGCVVFEAKSKDLCKLSYEGRVFNRVILLLEEFDFNEFDSKVEEFGKSDVVKEWAGKGTFAVRCERHDKGISSQEIEEKAGKQIDGKVDLKNADVTFIVYNIGEKCYIGVDYSGELSKRDYKVFPSSASLRGTIGYAMLRIAGYSGKESVLDVFCKDGVIPIEAALYATGKSVNHYRKDKMSFLKFEEFEVEDNAKKGGKVYAYDGNFANINAAKKNAKIAGVEKAVKFSRTTAEDLDLKFKEKEVDLIVTKAPFLTQRSARDAEKYYKSLFYQADYMLKGKIAVMCNNAEKVKEYAKQYKFKLEEEREIEIGKEKVSVLVFSHWSDTRAL